jgi:hypothetical protein
MIEVVQSSSPPQPASLFATPRTSLSNLEPVGPFVYHNDSDLRSSYFGSPAFHRKARISGGSSVDSLLDPFVTETEEDVFNESPRKRARTSWGVHARWRLADRVPSLGKPDTEDMTLEDAEVVNLTVDEAPSTMSNTAEDKGEQEASQVEEIDQAPSPLKPFKDPFPTASLSQKSPKLGVFRDQAASSNQQSFDGSSKKQPESQSLDQAVATEAAANVLPNEVLDSSQSMRPPLGIPQNPETPAIHPITPSALPIPSPFPQDALSGITSAPAASYFPLTRKTVTNTWLTQSLVPDSMFGFSFGGSLILPETGDRGTTVPKESETELSPAKAPSETEVIPLEDDSVNQYRAESYRDEVPETYYSQEQSQQSQPYLSVPSSVFRPFNLTPTRSQRSIPKSSETIIVDLTQPDQEESSRIAHELENRNFQPLEGPFLAGASHLFGNEIAETPAIDEPETQGLDVADSPILELSETQIIDAASSPLPEQRESPIINEQFSPTMHYSQAELDDILSGPLPSQVPTTMEEPADLGSAFSHFQQYDDADDWSRLPSSPLAPPEDVQDTPYLPELVVVPPMSQDNSHRSVMDRITPQSPIEISQNQSFDTTLIGRNELNLLISAQLRDAQGVIPSSIQESQDVLESVEESFTHINEPTDYSVPSPRRRSARLRSTSAISYRSSQLKGKDVIPDSQPPSESIPTIAEETGSNGATKPMTIPDSQSELPVSTKLSTLTPQEEETSSQVLEMLSHARSKTEIRGLRTPITYYTPLPHLIRHLNRSSQFDSRVNIIAIVSRASSKVERAKTGARDHFTKFRVTQPDSWPSSTLVQIFRPFKSAVPLVTKGDVVLLSMFDVIALKGGTTGLNSGEPSGWVAWRTAQGSSDVAKDATKPEWARRMGSRIVEEVTGPPVELGDEEREAADRMAKWWVESEAAKL